MKITAKEHYQKLRLLTCEELWNDEVPKFNQLAGSARVSNVAVVRAVGVIFSESGTPNQRDAARKWLKELLNDPEEKVRRYAMTALPKIGGDTTGENQLLDLLEKTSSAREKQHLGRTLEKIGGAATLERTGSLKASPLARTVQKVQANIARSENPGEILLNGILESFSNIHLRCRSGLEEILENEVLEDSRQMFQVLQRNSGVLTIRPQRPFSLNDILEFRGFHTLGLILGTIDSRIDEAEQIAQIIASPLTRQIFEKFHNGPIRYRLEFPSRGHQRGLIRSITDRVYELCPALINDSRDATWQMDVHSRGSREFVELTPRLRPDPRFAYRLRDVPAASHPPLAACMARLAGPMINEVVWDPFCGSGLELIECAKRGSVQRLIGTDLSKEATDIAQANVASAMGKSISADFFWCDFRDYEQATHLRKHSVSLIISNPPMGRRVPIPDLEGLIADLFSVAENALKPGGRLVFANPVSVRPRSQKLKLEYRQKIDLGGFFVHLEKYSKS